MEIATAGKNDIYDSLTPWERNEETGAANKKLTNAVGFEEGHSAGGVGQIRRPRFS